MCVCNLWDLRFHNEYFVDTYSEDDPTLLSSFQRSVNLMNLDRDREVTAVNLSSRPVDMVMGGSTWGPWPSAGRTLFSSEETDSKS